MGEPKIQPYPELRGPPLIVTIEDVDGEWLSAEERARLGQWVIDHVGEFDPTKPPEILLMVGRARVRVRRLVIEGDETSARIDALETKLSDARREGFEMLLGLAAIVDGRDPDEAITALRQLLEELPGG